MATKNRKAAVDFYVDVLTDMLGSREQALWHKENLLDPMSDEEFDSLMAKYASGEEIAPIIVPNMTNVKLKMERNLAVAKKHGIAIFQRIEMTDAVTGVTFITPKEYMVVDMPVRLQVEQLDKKIKIPEDNKHVDERTGQPTGPSKGSSVSFPELQVMSAQGFNAAIKELLRWRGGDEIGFQAMNRQIVDNGTVRLETLARLPTKVKSTETLGAYLMAAHLDNNLNL